MGTDAHRLTIIGDIGVDLVLGPLSGWPRVGTETIMERSELRAGASLRQPDEGPASLTELVD
jgi:hypothetical protein